MTTDDDAMSIDTAETLDTINLAANTIVKDILPNHTIDSDMPIKVFHNRTKTPREHTREKKPSCAVIAQPFLTGHKTSLYSSNTRRCDMPTWRVLLDSGSDDNLLFLRKGSKVRIPYVTWKIPQNWRTSNGTFCTNRVADMELHRTCDCFQAAGYSNLDCT